LTQYKKCAYKVCLAVALVWN